MASMQHPPCRSGQRREEALGSPGQHPRHDEVDRHGRERRADIDGERGRQKLPEQQSEGHPTEGVHHAHQDRPDQRPADGADAADDHHHEAQDQDALAHPDLHRQQGPQQGPGHGAQRGPQAEDRGEERRDPDSHHQDHLAVGGARPHPHARASLGNQQVEQDRREDADPDDQQAIGGVGEARQQLQRARQGGRQAQEERLGPEDQAHHLVADEDQGKGGQDLAEVVAAVQDTEDRHLERHPDGRGG
jgi:hypothetical protein